MAWKDGVYEVEPWQLEVVTVDTSTDDAVERSIGKRRWASGFGGERDMSFDFATEDEALQAERRLINDHVEMVSTSIYKLPTDEEFDEMIDLEARGIGLKE